MKNYKYTTTFSSVVKPVVSEEKDKYLALASMVELEKFLPEVDIEKNVDLLPVAFNAFVANRVNKNGDVVDTDTAVAMYENFINKPINIEHNRKSVVGTILTAEINNNLHNPAIVLTIDFGKEIGIKKSSAQLIANYTCDSLIKKQILAVVNFPPRQVGKIISEVLVLGLSDNNNQPVLISPDLNIKNGKKLY